jgi:peptidoglycan/xylan/chitin deacetylase (PgdA/CDA1 family)
MPGTDPFLFLTFDDGPTPEVTLQVLDILKRFDAKATFFCVGENIKKHPDVFHKILEDGHAVGNHTFHHLDGWKTDTRKYLGDVFKCQDLIKEISGQQMLVHSLKPTANCELPTAGLLFRPPYGKLKPAQIKSLRKDFKIIMWDVLSRDYNQNISEEQCLLNVTRHARNGSIVVFHDSMKAKDRVLYALPKVLEHFSKQHFSFKALSPDLL